MQGLQYSVWQNNSLIKSHNFESKSRQLKVHFAVDALQLCWLLIFTQHRENRQRISDHVDALCIRAVQSHCHRWQLFSQSSAFCSPTTVWAPRISSMKLKTSFDAPLKRILASPRVSPPPSNPFITMSEETHTSPIQSEFRNSKPNADYLAIAKTLHS